MTKKPRDANDILREEGTDALRACIDVAGPPAEPASNGRHRATRANGRSGANGIPNCWADGAVAADVSVQDFYAYMPMHSYIFVPSREPWPAGSVNAVIPPIATDDGKIRATLGSTGTRPSHRWPGRQACP